MFARVFHNCLFLSQYNITDDMTEAMSQYIRFMKDINGKQIEAICIDDCGMTDHRHASLLRALKEQGKHLKRIILDNNMLIGSETISEIIEMVGQLDEISIHNPKKNINFEMLDQLFYWIA